MKYLGRALVVLIVVAIPLSWWGATTWINTQLDWPLNVSTSQEEGTRGYYLDVPRGASLSRVLDRLSDDAVIGSVWPLKILARQENRQHIHAGEYLLRPDESQRDLLDKLNRGDVIQHRITFAEGLNLREWLTLLRAETRLDSQAAQLEEDELIELLDPSLKSLEGWLYPDTYQFTRGDSDLAILRRAYRTMQHTLAEAWEKRADELPYKTPYEALIMASLIEKETGVPSERPEIAGVFVRRLQVGMRLQTDPTVIYGLGQRFEGNLRREHLREPGPYNTYHIPALPPTPIAMPGKAAIEAALNPAPGDTFYFVARGDGSHHFSRTLDEHNRAVRKYQIEKRRADYRSSPTR